MFAIKMDMAMKDKCYLIYENKRDNLAMIPFSGERGIRTPGPVTVNGFQDRRIRPLCHLSGAKIQLQEFQSKSICRLTLKVLKTFKVCRCMKLKNHLLKIFRIY